MIDFASRQRYPPSYPHPPTPYHCDHHLKLASSFFIYTVAVAGHQEVLPLALHPQGAQHLRAEPGLCHPRSHLLMARHQQW